MLDIKGLVELSEDQHGKPYNLRPWKRSDLYSKNPKDFDCSSLVMWVYFMFGFKLPRVSKWQYNYCEKLDSKNKKLGDLFFLSEDGSEDSINHVGIYIGSGMCIEAAGGRAGKVIRSFATKNESRNDFVGWRRVPLEQAQDDFFKFVKKHPKSKKAKPEEKAIL